MDKIISIHQPNFFPWIGYFDKIIRSDKFILLDSVSLPKKGSSWTNRVQLNLGKKSWVTASVDKKGSKNAIIVNTNFKDFYWQTKLNKSLYQFYSKHPFFIETMNIFEDLIFYQEKNLSKFNTYAIKKILENLEINTTQLFTSSELNQPGSSNELLVNLIKKVDGNIYLCGDGAAGYQDDNLFYDSNIKINYQCFNHPKYNQIGCSDFIPGLSIIDCLMNIGWEGTSKLLNNGKNK